MDIDGYKLCALYRLCNAQRTRTVFCRKELREKVGARIRLFLGLKSAHTDRLFVVISSEIGAILYRSKSHRTRTDFHSDTRRQKNRSVCAGHNIYSFFGICGNVYDRLDYETHAADKTMLIYKYGNITYKS